MDSIDAMQQRWQAHDARLAEVVHLNRRILLSLESGRTRSALERVARTLWTQFAVDALAVLALGSFVGGRVASALAGAPLEGRFLIPALALLLPAIAVFAAVIAQLAQLAAIDPAGPVTEMQRRLERLRTRRIAVTKAVILLAPALWIAVAIVLLRGLAGVDLYAWVPRWWIWLNVGVGLALVPVMIWASRRFFDRLGHLPRVQRLAHDLAGTGFREAHEQLARLAAFEREDLPA
jgi:hypothetical protein